MGSALTRPATVNGHEVTLWGTSLDDGLLDAVEAGEPHPRHGVRLDPAVRTVRHDGLAAALEGAELVAVAIASEGVLDVVGRVAGLVPTGVPILLLTKGFARVGGEVRLLPDVLGPILGTDVPWVVGAGPCKANEVAASRPTATVYAATDTGARDTAAKLLGTADYRVAATEDPIGVEMCAACKNVYAMGLGLCIGLSHCGGEPFHDLQAAVFARACVEMASLSMTAGGLPQTAFGLAGVGDLEVTGLSGRNRIFGERVGCGQRPEAAWESMRAAGQTVEGMSALRLAVEFAGAAEHRGDLTADDVALLHALNRVFFEGAGIREELAAAALPG